MTEETNRERIYSDSGCYIRVEALYLKIKRQHLVDGSTMNLDPYCRKRRKDPFSRLFRKPRCLTRRGGESLFNKEVFFSVFSRRAPDRMKHYTVTTLCPGCVEKTMDGRMSFYFIIFFFWYILSMYTRVMRDMIIQLVCAHHSSAERDERRKGESLKNRH